MWKARYDSATSKHVLNRTSDKQTVFRYSVCSWIVHLPQFTEHRAHTAHIPRTQTVFVCTREKRLQVKLLTVLSCAARLLASSLTLYENRIYTISLKNKFYSGVEKSNTQQYYSLTGTIQQYTWCVACLVHMPVSPSRTQYWSVRLWWCIGRCWDVDCVNDCAFFTIVCGLWKMENYETAVSAFVHVTFQPHTFSNHFIQYELSVYELTRRSAINSTALFSRYNVRTFERLFHQQSVWTWTVFIMGFVFGELIRMLFFSRSYTFAIFFPLAYDPGFSQTPTHFTIHLYSYFSVSSIRHVFFLQNSFFDFWILPARTQH